MPLDQIDVDKMDQQGSEMSFLDHLEELRWHLIRAVVSILVFAVIAFLAENLIFDSVILGHMDQNFPTYRFFCNLGEWTCFHPLDFKLETIALEEQFVTHLKVSFVIGIIISFPYIFWEIWRFVKPGLYPNEQKAARGMVFICSFLFFLGVLFGYYVIAPFAVTFLSNYSVGAGNVGVAPRLSSYVNLVGMLTLPVGIVFELPVAVYFFSKIGVLTPEFMRSYRRHAAVIILILSAVITPPDVVTQLLISIPLYLLYEISIHISKRVQVQKEAEENE